MLSGRQTTRDSDRTHRRRYQTIGGGMIMSTATQSRSKTAKRSMAVVLIGVAGLASMPQRQPPA